MRFLIAIDCLCVTKPAKLEDFVCEAAVEVVWVWVPRIFLDQEVMGHLFISLIFKVDVPAGKHSYLLTIFLWPNTISIILLWTYDPLLWEQPVVATEADAFLFIMWQVIVHPAPYSNALIGDVKALSILGWTYDEVTRLSLSHLIKYK